MRLHRFFTSEHIGSKEFVITSSEIVHQMRRVFRLKSGDSVIVFDGSGSDFVCQIEDFGKDSVILNVTEAAKSRHIPEKDLTLFAAVIKKDIFEWIVEKATEMGVTKIVPIITERSEKKSVNMERLKKIAREASEQSGRGMIPVVEPVIHLKDILEMPENSVVFHTDAPLMDRAKLKKTESVNVFIGPEGGWSDSEIDMFHNHNVPVVSLGPQVLRAETAVIASLAQIVF